MGKKRNDDEATVNWTRQNERALLLRLVDHQTTALGRHPTAADWDRWAEEIFGKGVPGERCKQKRNRLRKIFQLYSVLINASGLGWDSETGAVHCEAAYIDDFLARNPQAKDLIGKAVPNWALISQLFHRESATGCHAVASGSTRLTEARSPQRSNSEHDVCTDQMDLQDEINNPDDRAYIAHLAGLDGRRPEVRACNIAPTSRRIGKRQVRSKGVVDSDAATTALQSIAESLSSRGRSKGHGGGSSANQHTSDDVEWRQCITIMNAMNLGPDQYVDFTEYLSTNPKVQTAFLLSKEDYRMVFVQKGVAKVQAQQRHPPERTPPPPVTTQAPPPPFFHPPGQFQQDLPYFPRPPYGGHDGY